MILSNSTEFQVTGHNDNALFTLKAYRGEGMLLLAMDWKNGEPPIDFVGFAIEYKEPDRDRFYALKNRLSFKDADGDVSKESVSSLLAPIQKFRWVHFPRNADLKGYFIYKVKPAFMNDKDELSYGESQQVEIELSRETYPNQLNVTFTRGFISSQAFVDKYQTDGGVPALLPSKAKLGLEYKPTHPNAEEALPWMGFEATHAILALLDEAIADKKSKVRVIAYDLNLPHVVERLEQLGTRLKIVIDDSGDHGDTDSAESMAADRLKSRKSHVKRQHMNQLQHNKMIVIKGPQVNAAVCGSTNFSWRGFYVQANNAVIVRGENAIQPFMVAFDNYWLYNSVKEFGITQSASWNNLSLEPINAKISYSPHASNNALLKEIADDLENNTQSSLFYSLAFLFETSGVMKDAILKLTGDDEIFVYGISDKEVGGLDLQKPSGNVLPVYSSAISEDFPEPFKSEPIGGTGTRMHHKFIVVDFDKPTARVYLGSYNFSTTADLKNGENLLLIQDKKIAVAYMIEALRIFDHYHFRIAHDKAAREGGVFSLARPPRKTGEKAWWEEYYSDRIKIRDRELFGKIYDVPTSIGLLPNGVEPELASTN